MQMKMQLSDYALGTSKVWSRQKVLTTWSFAISNDKEWAIHEKQPMTTKLIYVSYDFDGKIDKRQSTCGKDMGESL